MHIDLDRALKSGVEETRTTQSDTHTHAIDLANSLEVSTRSERCEIEKHRNTAASRSRRLHQDSLLKQIRRSIYESYSTKATRQENLQPLYHFNRWTQRGIPLGLSEN